MKTCKGSGTRIADASGFEIVTGTSRCPGCGEMVKTEGTGLRYCRKILPHQVGD